MDGFPLTVDESEMTRTLAEIGMPRDVAVREKTKTVPDSLLPGIVAENGMPHNVFERR